MLSEMPRCPYCGQLARPNVLIFNDAEWVSERTHAQFVRLKSWLTKVKRLVVIEMGAGTNIPSVRRRGEALSVPLIRINPRDPEVFRAKDIALPMGALTGLRLVQAQFNARPVHSLKDVTYFCAGAGICIQGLK